MYYLYIIQSKRSGKRYIGITADFQKRVDKHNSGSVRSTKAYRPWMLIRKEEFPDKKSARIREIFLKKTAKARKELFEKIEIAPIV